jgi:hypothetical protein
MADEDGALHPRAHPTLKTGDFALRRMFAEAA